MSVIARRYADALFSLAKARGQEKVVLDELELVAEAIEAHPDFFALLNHPRMNVKEKKTLLLNVFASALSELTQNFLKLLLDKGRQNLLSSIVQQYADLVNEARGVAIGQVVTAVELSAQARKQLEAAFTSKVGKRVELKNVVDKTIKGGVLLRIGDRVYDGSVAGRLSRFKGQLRKAQV